MSSSPCLPAALLMIASLCTTAASGNNVVRHWDILAGGDVNGGWSFVDSPDCDRIVEDLCEHHPDQYLRNDCVDSIFPQLDTTGQSLFTGNLRESGVVAMGLDVRTNWIGMAVWNRPFTIILIHDGEEDLWVENHVAFYAAPNGPEPNDGWRSYSFPVPAAETETPNGWTVRDMANPWIEPTLTWNDIVTNVRTVKFIWGDIDGWYNFILWDVSAANFWVDVSACSAPADLNCDGVVDVFDLLALLAAWGPCPVEGECPADLDENGIVDVFDLLLLLADWG